MTPLLEGWPTKAKETPSRHEVFKFTGKFCVMTMENDTKFEEELTCQFKIDMRNWTNFELNTRKSQKFAL